MVMIRQVKNLPASRSHTTSAAEKDVREFIRSGMRFAEMEIEGKTAKKIKDAVDGYCKTHGLKQVACKTRSGKAYLIRLDVNIR